MKRCPQCNRTYTDDALSFCLDDGSPLTIASGPPPADPSATVQYPQSRDTSPQPTIAYNPVQAAPPPPLPPQTPAPAWSPMPPQQTQKRSVWPWVLGIGAVLLLMGIGVIVLAVMVARVTNDNNGNRVANNSNNSNNANWKTANRNKNTNSDNTNENTNTSTTPSTFTDDFAAAKWGTGTWDDGRAWYSDEEYHMHAISGRFIEMYAPENDKDYYTRDATVKVGLRSIDGNPPNTGYGMVVHGEKKDNKLEDYGFLIYNGPEPKYKIILHKGGVETNIVSWTSSNVIRTGTSPNQIEVRISGLKLDLYINGQFITSITDTAGYKTGRVGFYTSDAGEVAFDDLEIDR